jgi:hypothetical protein
MADPDSAAYDIAKEIAASRDMLEQRIPRELNRIKLALVEIDKHRCYEPWRLALTVDLVDGISTNCEQLLDTFGKDRLPATAWLARNLLELLVWAKYCGVSRENAWRFHEDALRDVKGLVEQHARTCVAMGIENEIADTAIPSVRRLALDKLGLDEIDSDFLTVSDAAKTDGVDLGNIFGPCNRILSKFAHPTAGVIHGFTHKLEPRRQLQAAFTTQGVYYGAQGALALESQLGIQHP